MKCPNCETENEDSAKFCRTCGINLQETYTFEEKKEETKYVTTVENINDREYNRNNSNNTYNETSNSSSSWWVCCICLIGIFIIFAIFSH